MMSTNTMSGWWSAIFDSASKPSTAVYTSQPSFDSSVSAVRRIVLLSSMTSTFRPASRADWFVARFSIGTSHGESTHRTDARAKYETARIRVLASTCDVGRRPAQHGRTFNILVIGPPSPTFLYYEARHTDSSGANSPSPSLCEVRR